jgi:hypothetical protein
VLNAMLLLFYEPPWLPAVASPASVTRATRPISSPQPS